jgi:hypothetical protein
VQEACYPAYVIWHGNPCFQRQCLIVEKVQTTHFSCIGLLEVQTEVTVLRQFMKQNNEVAITIDSAF